MSVGSGSTEFNLQGQLFYQLGRQCLWSRDSRSSFEETVVFITRKTVFVCLKCTELNLRVSHFSIRNTVFVSHFL